MDRKPSLDSSGRLHRIKYGVGGTLRLPQRQEALCLVAFLIAMRIGIAGVLALSS